MSISRMSLDMCGDDVVATTQAVPGWTRTRGAFAKATPRFLSDFFRICAAKSGGFEDACGWPRWKRSSFTESAEIGGQSCQ